MMCLKSRVLCALLISPVLGASSEVRPAEFKASEGSHRLLMSFPSGTTWTYKHVYSCDTDFNASACPDHAFCDTCSRTEDVQDLTWPLKTYKIVDGGPDAYAPFLEDWSATHGFDSDALDPFFSVDAVTLCHWRWLHDVAQAH